MEAGKNDLPKETEQLWPKISIHILYAPHATERDVEPIREKFIVADIYIPEAEGWTNDQLQAFRMVSEGEITPAQLFQSQGLRRVDAQHFYASLEMVRNSHKPIIFIDVPREHKNVEAFFKWEKEREDYMRSMLPIKIKEILNEYPDIKRRDSLNILVALGSQHTRLYSKLKQEGYDVNKEEIPSYGFFDKGMKAYMFGGDIDDELAAKIFLEEEFATAYKKDINGLTDNVINRLHLKQKIISQFSFTEAEEIFGAIQEGKNLRVILDLKLKEKGIKFPQSPAQLFHFLRN